MLIVNFISDNNITAYMEYHEWRTLIPDVLVLNSTFIGFDNLASQEKDFCLLCRLIRNKRRSPQPNQEYQSITKFWRYDVHNECKENATFPHFIENIKQNKHSYR